MMIPAMDVPLVTAESRTVASVSNHTNATSGLISERLLHCARAAEIEAGCCDVDDDDDEDEDERAKYEDAADDDGATCDEDLVWPALVEKSLIIHRDENGFGLVLKGQAPVYVEHVHENGAAWRAGVRPLDRICKVNGMPAVALDHKEVVLMFKSCTRFVGLTLLSCLQPLELADMMDPSGSKSLVQRAGLLLKRDSRHLTRVQPRHQLEQYLLSSSVAAGSISSRLSSSTLGVSFDIEDTDADADEYDDTHGNRWGCSRRRTQHQNQQATQHSHKFSQNLFISSGSASNASSSYNLSHHTSLAHQHQNGSATLAVRPQNPPALGTSRLSPYERQLATLHQQVVARKSETQRHNYLSSQQLVASPASTFKHHHSLSLKVDQRSSSAAASNSNLDASSNKQQRQVYCINCRSQIISQQASAVSATDLIACSSCQLDHFARQRSYGSMRDPRQQQQSPCDIQKKPQVAQVAPQFTFKLSQSASTNSLRNKSELVAGNNRLSSTAAPSIVLSGESRSKSQDAEAAKRPATNKRLEIIREFIDTEKTHTDRLRCLDELFYRPLKAGGYMSAEQLRAVFSCHRSLFKIHRQIYRILQSANYNLYTEPMVGSALLEIFESDLRRRLEKAASAFCAAQSTNTELLNKLTRVDTKVGEFLAQVTRQQMVGRLGIKDLLASCFQRLTKYPLLLENLLKATPLAPPPPPAKPARRRRGRLVSDSQSPEDTVAAAETDSLDEELEDEEEETDEARNSRRMLAIGLAEEREFIERALHQSRQILVRVNDSVKVAMSHKKLREIWKRTDKYPGVPLIDITKQQVIHEGSLTLRLAKRSFDVYVLLLNDYLIILTREGQDKYRLKFFTPDGKSSSSSSGQTQSVYSPVFVIDEHLATRDAATDENGFYLLCKRKDDSRIYEFASRSPAERIKWRDRIQWTIERQISKADRRPSCESSITKSSSEISAKHETEQESCVDGPKVPPTATVAPSPHNDKADQACEQEAGTSPSNDKKSKEPMKIEGTISYVEDDGIVMPSKMESSWALVEQAVQVNICDSKQRELIQSS